jgi:hypothetical protein
VVPVILGTLVVIAPIATAIYLSWSLVGRLGRRPFSRRALGQALALSRPQLPIE